MGTTSFLASRAGFGRMRSAASALLYYWPFSAAGTLLLALVLPLLVGGLRGRNPYAVAIGSVALLALALLGLAGRIQAAARADAAIQWDSSTPLVARSGLCIQNIECVRGPLAPFFRLHADVTGRLIVGERASLAFVQEAASPDGARIPLPLAFPLSGEVRVAARLALKDLFGLTRARFGDTLERSMVVQPASFSEIRSVPLRAARGEEETSRHAQADEERYFMREYVPGDRLRDINWKASSRLQELVTRISPVTQEKTQTVQVEYRHFAERDSLDSVVHLDFLKSWLLTFLRREKRENPKYVFRVLTGRGVFELEREEDIEDFARELALLGGERDPEADMGRQDGGEVFVFSTPFDVGLARALGSYRKAEVWLYRTRCAGPNDAGAIEVPLAGMLAQVGAAPLLPGRWAWVRRRPPAPAAPIPATRVQEAPLAIRPL